MSTSPEAIRICEECGASIYPEMLKAHTAGRLGGRLLCPHCVQAHRSRAAAARSAAASAGAVPPEAPATAPGTAGPADAAASSPDLPVITLEEEPGVDVSAPSRHVVHGGGGITFDRAAEDRYPYRRPLAKGAPYATRCRTFHCKLSDSGFAHLNQQINEWIDRHDEIEVKFATSTIGVVEGKHADPHLIITIFY
jgi:hypothetical protein